MKRRHEMPFGAECRDDGTVRFQLWAPAARRVEVCLDRPNHHSNDTSDSDATTTPFRIPLTPRENGWFELVTRAAGPGSRYRFQIDDALAVPDPASRFQPQDVHGPSEVIDPAAFDWQHQSWHDQPWHGRPWKDAVIYELHVGAFTSRGTFSAVRGRLDYLAELGITAIELMPVADFPGRRNWGYDGVLPFAPDSTYGRPDDLKQLVQAAHSLGIMVLLDVVYNHFGPEGNYLNSYAPQFFTDRHHTPWGNAINFDGPMSRPVRDFFIHNALYWLTEYQLDGLRLDAVHAIVDDSTPDILTELANTVRSSLGPDRHVHLILENDRNQARYLQRNKECHPRTYTAQWNDDIHHALHVLMTGEKDAYYSDYSQQPLHQLGRCLVAGFAYQGEVSTYRHGQLRGEPTDHLPFTAFIDFLQNHDQIGNRAFGERITQLADPRAVRAAAAILLLAPSTPMIFMGEEFGAETPFLFFCDFEGDLAAAVTAGRRAEFAQFPLFSSPAERERIPDPNSPATFEASRLDWNTITQPQHETWLHFYTRLMKLRQEHIVPHLSCASKSKYEIHGSNGLSVYWTFPDNSELTLLANLDVTPLTGITPPPSPPIYTGEVTADSLQHGTLPPWSVVWSLKP